jgi:hypothetical protein
MIDFNAELKRLQAPPVPASPPPHRIDFAAELKPAPPPRAGQIDFAAELSAPPSPTPRDGYLSGGPVQKVFDVLRTGEYAVGGVLSRRPGESLGQSVLRGIRTREESAPQLARRLQQLGAPDSFVTDATAFAASLILDPINLIGVGLPGKVLRGVGAVDAAAKYEKAGAAIAAPLRAVGAKIAERVAPSAVAASRARGLLAPTLEEMARHEAVGIERAVSLGKALREDAVRLTGKKAAAQELDKAVGLYFDAGADTMLNRLAQAQQGAKQAAEIAQRTVREVRKGEFYLHGNRPVEIVSRDPGFVRTPSGKLVRPSADVPASVVVKDVTTGKTSRVLVSDLRRTGEVTRGAEQAAATMAALSKPAKISFDPEIISIARRAALAAQDAWLRSQPDVVQSFVRKWAPQLAVEDKRLAEALVQTGMIRPETAAKWDGIHLRRIYQQFEDPQAFVKFLEDTDPVKAAELLGQMERGVPLRRVGSPIPTAVAKPRQLLSEEARAAKGEIRQASSRYIAGSTMAERAVARGAAYQKIAREFGPNERLAQMLDGLSEKTAEALGWRRMPDTSGWGELAGKWIPKEMHDALTQMTTRSEGLLERTTGWFKEAKVVLNPATHMRNIRTNIMLAHNQAGLGAMNPATWARAVREVTTNGELFREAKAASSAFTDTFTATELRALINDPTDRGLAALWTRFRTSAARVYQAEEQIGKMVVYLTERGRGLSPQAAAKSAELALFNYRKVPPAIDRMRRIGIYPFITFPYKVATETIPQAIRRPGRFSQQAKLIGAVDQPLTDQEQRVLPDYMRRGTYIKLPLRVNGHPVLYDLGYELPYGDIAETGTPLTAFFHFARQLASGNLDVAESMRTLTPLLPPAVQVVAELLLNRSGFTGQKIAPEGETPRKQAELYGAHVVRFAAPSIVSKTVLPGGEMFRAIQAARPGGATGVSPSGVPALPLPYAAASTLAGHHTMPLDVQRERRNRALELQRMIGDIQTRMRSTARDQSLDADTRRRRLAEFRRMLVEVQQRYQQTGSAIAR